MSGNWADPATLGLKTYGKNVLISPAAILINPGEITLGDNVRIDAQCLLSAGQEGIGFGSYIHLAVGVSIFGGGGRVILEDHAQIACRSTILTSTDDFGDGALIGPTVPEEFRHVHSGPIHFMRYATVGVGCVVLPGITLGRGCSVGALSMIRRHIPPGEIWAGCPARLIGLRNLDGLEKNNRALIARNLQESEKHAQPV